jgi:hypothetical protein
MNTYIEQFKALKTEIIRNKHILIDLSYRITQFHTEGRILRFRDYPKTLEIANYKNDLLWEKSIPDYLQPFLEQAIADNIFALLNGAEALADEERKRLARNAAQEYAELLCESNE